MTKNTKNKDDMLRIYSQQAIKHEHKANKNTWISCLNCWMVSGRYGEGAVIGLAEDMGKSDDTVYARAHAYAIFIELCEFDHGRHRFFVHSVRRMPWVYWSHFREMWDLKRDFKLETSELFDLLMELYQAEGMSVRNMEKVVKSLLGKERSWQYYADRVKKEIEKTLGHPETPKRFRKKLKDTYEALSKE